MLRGALFIMTLCAFFTVVALGVHITHHHYNKMVLPDQPVSLFNLSEPADGVMQIDLLGETLAVDMQAVKDRADGYLQTAKIHWQEIIADPRLNQEIAHVKKTLGEKWEAWLNSEQVRAVNQWVKEQI